MTGVEKPTGGVVALPAAFGPHAIVEGLRHRDADAAMALHDRYGDLVNRLVWRLLGADAEHDDVVNQAFLNALSAIHQLRDAEMLEPWLVSITLNTVRREIRRRRLRRLFGLRAELPEVPSEADELPGRRLSAHFYAVLERLRAGDRLIMTLHYVEDMTLAEAAAACGCSLATAKRRLSHAKRAFERRARVDPVLADWIEAHGHAK